MAKDCYTRVPPREFHRFDGCIPRNWWRVRERLAISITISLTRVLSPGRSAYLLYNNIRGREWYSCTRMPHRVQPEIPFPSPFCLDYGSGNRLSGCQSAIVTRPALGITTHSGSFFVHVGLRRIRNCSVSPVATIRRAGTPLRRSQSGVGRLMKNVAPSPGVDSTQSRPSCRSIIFRQSANPMPVESLSGPL